MFLRSGVRSGWLALAAVALLAPAQAFAQTLTATGETVFGPSSCGDTTQPKVTDVAATLSYQYVTKAASNTQATVQLFATKSDCPAVASGATSVSPPGDALILVAANTNADTSSHTVSLKVSQLATPDCAAVQTSVWNVCFYEFYTPVATFGGTATPASAFTSLTLTYDSQPPGAPRLDQVSTGDEHLHVAFTGPGDSDIGGYEVLAVPVDAAVISTASSASGSSGSVSGSSGSSGSVSGSSSSSGSISGSSGSSGSVSGSSGSSGSVSGSSGSSGSISGSSGSSGSISGSSGSSGSVSGSSGSSGSVSGSSGSTGAGFTASACQPNAVVVAKLGTDEVTPVVPTSKPFLTNGRTYIVQVRAIDLVGNVGPCSNELQGTPQLINDFWRLYKADGGQDLGGCAQAGSGVALLGLVGALALLGLRRRKDLTR